MDLECHVEAYPPPAISWLKDEVQLSNNQHYSISHFATADEFTDTTLRVITIEKRQYGLFTCKAQNKLGTAEGQVQLFGQYMLLHLHVYVSIETFLHTSDLFITMLFYNIRWQTASGHLNCNADVVVLVCTVFVS